MATVTSRKPTTTEGAVARYSERYRRLFSGPKPELERLENSYLNLVQQIKKKAPSFYEDKLVDIIYQASQKLLLHDMSTPEGRQNFHLSHKWFCKVLEELTRTQPSGEVSLDTEVDRIQHKERLYKEQLELREEYSRLESIECDIDDLGDESRSGYAKIWNDIQKVSKKLRNVSILIAKLEGHEIDSKIEFRFIDLPKRDLLNSRLTNHQLGELEKIVTRYLNSNDKKEDLFIVTKEDSLKMLSQLGPLKMDDDQYLQAAEALCIEISKFHRYQKRQKREEYHRELISDPSLLPKEGKILKDENDLPDAIREAMDEGARAFSEQHRQIVKLNSKNLEEAAEGTSARGAGDEDEDDMDDDEEDDDADDDGSHHDDAVEYIETHRGFFQRIKEEPDSEQSGEEDDGLVETELQNGHVVGMRVAKKVQAIETPNDDGGVSDDVEEAATNEASSDGATFNAGSQIGLTETNSQMLTTNEESEDECVMLGVVEPISKCTQINLD